MEQNTHVAGFFGKVMSHGDFVMRRLPAGFLREWDNWLQAGLQHSRERLGEQWLAVYLCSPVWRFALSAGVCGEQAWCGVMIPSLDRVGRYFPLTLAASAPPAPLLQRLEFDGDWYGQLERLALSSLADGFSLERFDAQVDCLAPLSPAMGVLPQEGGFASPAAASWLDIPGLDRLAEALPWLRIQIDDERLAGHCLFWTEGSPQLPPSLLVSAGLPSAMTFADMLDGRHYRE
ncbi:type VI secretion system-associated protein TagF [Pseudomonas gingeri]|uniref:Type VI secretion system-associated protein TagF n=1 Tax=Pseudomonas gingeri TaxID=117681 RepID=A0A7Y7Y9J7_9PSED|nr:type VI secretion system-associated protein TagF [Pseudomonas gingeri]NWA02518.1 type VI secretion system-associated protein TagF [Pseudomonas gingeri]NWA12309.1 type VI secretion system-associated protein TagF [Pseudomonas gingeri]NWA57285.1 type VI secretion system-associated protein TagF [Pseudomonas gingeri]NWA93628.1 type VI secretion system-associated protein TagF [Pseudomonas gingeri]NWB03100.1 type VI secretion system-associated protein TagF [Pseudomonas gingeri]